MYQILDAEQRRMLTNIRQQYAAYREVQGEREEYAGGMHWKRSEGREYLFRSRNRRGYGKSLGPRSPETEQIHEAFHRRKRELDERYESLKAELERQARLCVAAGLGRVPRAPANVIRVLERHGLLGRVLRVAGSNAMYAYEAAAGVQLEAGLLETRDLDLFYDHRASLELLGNRPETLLHALREADKSFELAAKGHFRAVSGKGFEVELIKPMPSPPMKSERRHLGSDVPDLEAAEIEGLDRLRDSPAFEQVVVAEDGYPVRLVTNDPRFFAAHKLWLSNQSGREPVKARRDEAQAKAVLQLLVDFLPQYPLDRKSLQALPGAMRRPLLQAVNGISESPSDSSDVPGL